MDSPSSVQDIATCKTEYLEQFCAQETPEVLEAGVTAAFDVLDQLKDALATCSHKSPETDTYLTHVAQLRERDVVPKTVVGVVGSTGAGKSSIINALLDEERLLPTNCMRACTAAPTEISYNHSDDPEELYQAEVEFISEEDWVQELETLLQDIVDVNGRVTSDILNSSTDAGIAFAKVKAVYPRKTKEMIARSSPKALAHEPDVRRTLGSTVFIMEASATDLYGQLQQYVDSAEKPTRSRKRERELCDSAEKPTRSKKRERELWPLIKVVRIRTKADALSTGAVIVDLPGVQDSNAARAAVADKYMRSCTSLWIVAPINRAVDDKVAQNLLSDSFRRQLKYDGVIASLTFICSKTDDISESEASESLGMGSEFSAKWDYTNQLQRNMSFIKSRIEENKKITDELDEKYDAYVSAIELWDLSLDHLSNGELVYLCSEKHNRVEVIDLCSDASNDSDGSYHPDGDFRMKSEDIYEETMESDDSEEPLTKEQIDEILSSLRSQRKQLQSQISLRKQESEYRRQELDRINGMWERSRDGIRAMCIQRRNTYAKSAIKHDFANGVKELDQEIAEEEDEENFDPDEDARDYEALAQNLPVFCVSSRVYQRLQGRLEKDNTLTSGFRSLEATEIPKLQKHAKSLTVARRTMHCRSFLNEVLRLVNSIKLWSWDDGSKSSSMMLDDEKLREEHLEKLLHQLEEDTDALRDKLVQEYSDFLEDNLFKSMYAAGTKAAEVSHETVLSWGAPRKDGGLFWSTYRATVRRMGAYTGYYGHRDFNQELFDPLHGKLAGDWEQAFQVRLPSALCVFVSDATKSLREFHETATARAEELQINPAGLMILSNQLESHIKAINVLPTTICAKITELQRAASRQFTPVIRDQMSDGYDACMQEKGEGTYYRMKHDMDRHIIKVRYEMFEKAADVVKSELENLCDVIEKQLNLSLRSILDSIDKDYTHALVGGVKARYATQALEEEQVRATTRKILIGSDDLFRSALDESLSQSTVEVVDTDAKTLDDDEVETDDDEVETDDDEVKTDDDGDDDDHRLTSNEIDELVQAHIRKEALLDLGLSENEDFTLDNQLSEMDTV